MKRFALLLTLVALLGFTLPGAAIAQKSKLTTDKLPMLLGSTNAGNEFYFSFPPCYEEESAGGDNSVRVYIASGVRQEVRLEVLSQGFVLTKVVPANDVVEFRIPTTVGQPFLKAGRSLAPPERVYPGAAVHIKSKAPIIAYGMTRYQYTSDGFLAVPVSGLGEEYIVAAWPQYTAVGAGYQLASLTTISAAYDDTQMTFEMAGNNVSQTTGGMKPGQSKTFKMMKGDVVCVSAAGDLQDVAGSYIKADKPVGVVSGNQCANVPAGVPWCDYTSEMELPIKTWGTEYHVTPIAKRKQMPIIRIFAKEKNTTIYKDGLEWRKINRNTRLQNSGYLELRPPVGDDGKPFPIVVSSDKPIYVMLYNTGQADDDVPSDPFQYILTPLEQYQTEIVFCTPGARGGTLPFTEHYVNFVYELTTANSIPDDCEFATVVNGKFKWDPISSRFGSSPGQIFKVPVRGKTYACKRLDLPGDGVYRIRAKGPFAAYAYGFSSYDSYGFPTSVALGDLTKKDSVAPMLDWKQLCDGTVEGATAEDLPKDPDVRSNLALIYMDPDPAESFNYTFSFDKNNTFVSGQTIKTDWRLTVDDPTQDAQATLYFVDRAGNETKLVVTYSAYSVTLTPSPVNYNTLKPGQQVTKQVTLKNTGKKDVTITKLELKDKGQGFTIVGATLPMTLMPGETKLIDVMFTNMVEGNYKDSIGVGNDCLFKNLVLVTAEVVAPIIEVSDIDYGTILETDTKTLPMYVRNVGKVDLAITGWTGPTNTTVFKANMPQNLKDATVQNPVVIPPGGNIPFDVTFDPDAVNTFSDKIVFANDAKNNGTFRDNVGNLIGQAVTPMLTASPMHWERKRIKSRRTPNTAYMGTITLENRGTAPITVIQATSPASSVFSYSATDFAGIQFQPGEKKDFTVSFDPDAVGPHVMDITFVTSDPTITPVSRLDGIGIVPRITTKDVDFGTTYLLGGVPQAPANIRQVEIICGSGDIYDDSVTITDFAASVAGTVGTVATGQPGTEGFRFDIATVIPGGKLVLQPTDRVTFNADFLAQRVGTASAALTTKSDAESEATSKWTGLGVENKVPVRDASVTSGSVGPICVGRTATFTIRLTNTGTDAAVDLNNLEFIPQDGTFSLATPIQYPLTLLKTGDFADITILYSPKTSGTHNCQLKLTTSAKELIADLSGTAELFNRTTSLVASTSSTTGATKVNVGEDLFVSVKLDNGNGSIINAQADKISATVTFDKTLLSYVEVKGVNGNTVSNPKLEPDGNAVTFDVAPASSYFDPATELAVIKYRVMLPQTTGEVATDKITLKLSTTANDCLILTPINAEVVIDPTCGYSYRKIIGSGKAYSLTAIGPNPVITDEMDVNMSIGMQAGTELTVYSAAGQVVKRVDLGSLEAGEYDVKVDVSGLSSGSYTVRLRSGLYSSERQVVITK